MKRTIRLMVLGLCLVNGMTTGSADVVIDGQVVQAADISQITIDPVSGDINVSAGGLYTVVRDTDPEAGPSVVINSLTASSTSILEGQSVIISWTTTAADSCTPSNGGGGWTSQVIALPSGSSAALTLATAGTYSFRLNCSNATPSSTFRTVSVTVNADDPAPGDDCPTPTLAGNTVSWAGHFTQTWPDPIYAEVTTSIPRAGYLAIAFNTGNFVDDGGIASIQHTSTSGNRLGAISECPGDFSQRLPDTLFRCTYEWYIGGGIIWNTESGDQSRECNLQPNTNYYLNLTFTDGVDPTTDRCVTSTGVCRTIMRVSH
jgi:hypothetical protein